IGLAFPIGAYEIAALALSNQQARRVLLEAGLYDPDTALQLGLVDAVVEPADLQQVCVARARLLGSYSRAAYAQTKRALQRDAVRRVLHEPEEQRRETAEVWSSPETLQVIQRHIERLAKRA